VRLQGCEVRRLATNRPIRGMVAGQRMIHGGFDVIVEA
jgi:hypothetical protein